MLFVQDNAGKSLCRPEFVACAHVEGLIMCGEPKSAHTAEAARGDVAMDHNFTPATFDATNTPDSMPPLTPDEHFARASGEARLALIWERLKQIQETLESNRGNTPKEAVRARSVSLNEITLVEADRPD